MSEAGAATASDWTDVATQLEEEIQQGRIELPLLPNVAAEVLSSSLDDQSDAARLAELIQQDQALASHVLRVVNSPAFRGAIEIVALQQAIARLGMERIREIALSASLKGTLFRKGCYQAVAEENWQIALAAGLWSKEVARSCRRNVEMAYLCGLLHNIGTPLVLHRLGELHTDMSRKDLNAVCDRVSHRAGVQLATAWELPELVCVSIEHLNEFDQAGDHQDMVAVTNIGAALGKWMCTREILITEVTALPTTQHMNLYPADVASILEKLDDIRLSMESMNL